MEEEKIRRRFIAETINELYKTQIEKLIKDNAKMKGQLEDQSLMILGKSSRRTIEDCADASSRFQTKRIRDTESDGQSSKTVELGPKRYSPRDHKEYAEYIDKYKLCVYDLSNFYGITSLSKKTGRPFILRCSYTHENPAILHVKDLIKLKTKYSKYAALCLVWDQFGYSDRDQALAQKLCERIIEDKEELFSSEVGPRM